MTLPVDPERLRAQFPELSDADLEAYVTVTRRILGEKTNRPRVTREILSTAERARAQQEAGAQLSADETTALGYLRAVEKMQRSTVTRRH